MNNDMDKRTGIHAGMVRLLLSLCLLVGMASASDAAVTHIYQGAYTQPSKILYTWDGKHLYQGAYAQPSKVLYTWDGKHV